MNHWSDVVANLYHREVAARSRNLEPIFRQNIVDKQTIAAMKWTFGGEIGEWSGNKFYSTTIRGSSDSREAFHVMMATPYAKGIFNMLMQHPDKFGKKLVKSIHVWSTGRPGNPADPLQYHMHFGLENALVQTRMMPGPVFIVILLDLVLLGGLSG